jgi:ADP-ribosyl-[dinitrogen reductase] hydrolase
VITRLNKLILDMLLEGAIGDAYGAGFEFAPRDVIENKNNLNQYIPHPRFKSVYKKYTDDTQMALAIAELIINDIEWTPLNIANKFVDVFKRDPREGYATRFYKLLTDIENGEELINHIKPESIRNGAVMRAYPIGVLPDIAEIKEKAAIQAAITHNTKEAITSSQAIALMSYYTKHKLGSLKHLPEFLFEHQNIKWSDSWSGEVEINAIQTVEAVLTILTKHKNSMKTMLIDSVNFGGDVDTVASLALAIASNTSEVKNDLPQWLYHNIENDDYGIDYIKQIDQKILGKYRSNPHE